MRKRDKPRDPSLQEAHSALSNTAIEARAEADEENPPWTDEEFARAKVSPRVKVVRRALRLTQEQFAARYMIPVQTVRAWEQGVTEPDAAGRAYIRAIIGDADGVANALRARAPTRAA